MIQKYIIENPLRLIGVISNSKISEIKRNINKIKAFIKVGKKLNPDYNINGLRFHNFKLEDYPIEKIESNINIPSNKIKFSLFWFANINPGDSIGLNLLKDDKLSKCLELWRKIVNGKIVTKDNFSTFNNLSTLLLLKNIDRQKNNFFNNINSNIEIKESINTKFKFLNSGFLESYFELISSSSKSISKNEITDFYSSTIQKMLENTFSQKEINSLLIDLEESVRNKIHGDKSNVLIRIITNEIKNSVNQRNENNSNKVNNPKLSIGYKSGRNLIDKTKAQIIELKNILGKSNLQYKNYADKLAKELEACGQLFLNETGSDYEYINIYNFALLISDDIKLKRQIKGTIKNSNDLKKSEGSKDILIAIQDYGSPESNSIISAKNFLDNCDNYLKKMKLSLGNKNDLYVTLSSKVAMLVLGTVIESSNKQNQIQNSEIETFNISSGLYSAQLSLERILNKTVRDLRAVNRLIKRLEIMDLNKETKSFLDRNKLVLRTNLKGSNDMLNQLKPSYDSSSYSSYSSSNYSSNSWADENIGCIIWAVILFIGFLMSNS